MSEPLGREGIRAHWTEQARREGVAPAASWSDVHAMHLETRTLSRYLSDGDRVLDIGCANGHSTLHHARAADITIRGLDYVPDMIRNARERLAGEPEAVRSRVSFAAGDILDIPEQDGEFDVVVCVRVLINLPTPADQARAVAECARVLRPGGRLLASEATVQGWRRLNEFRAEWDLPPIPVPPFNRYIDLDAVGDWTSRLELEAVEEFASTYYVGTRVLKPLLARGSPAEAMVPEPDTHWNRWWSQLPSAGDYGVQKLLVFRRTGGA